MDMKDSTAERLSEEMTSAAIQPTSAGQSGWQARKSAETRNQIINAAILCIIELGYSKTTTKKISERVGLSRGATLHHFPSKLDIIREVVNYLHHERLELFRRTINEVPQDSDVPHQAVRGYWAHLNHPVSQALFELSVAARTDKDLRDILRPAQQAFEEEGYQTAWELSPDWHSDRKAFELARNLFQHLLEGMAISDITQGRDYDQDGLLEYLEEQMRELRPSK